MSDMCEIEIWVLVDEDGDYVVVRDRDDIASRWEEEVGERDSGVQTRLMRLVVRVPRPRRVDAVIEVPDVPGCLYGAGIVTCVSAGADGPGSLRR